MAKRRRLTPARPGFLSADAPAPETKSLGRAPIAQVAGDAAAIAAVEELSGVLQAARDEGRMVLALALDEVHTDYLERDRLATESEAQAALVASIRERGQQTPIEVQALADGGYGLISGWRRFLALRQLHQETGEARFALVLALLRRPEDQAQAYIAMVEENEVRADLSYFERARIVRRAVESGVFETEKQALKQLFSTASYAKRSKIKSFLSVVDGLEEVLKFPTHIPERTGLQLARLLVSDPAAGEVMRDALRKTPPKTAEEEASILLRLTRPPVQKQSLTRPLETDSPKSQRQEVVPGIRLSATPGHLELDGPGVNAGLIDRLQDWLRSQG